MAQTTLEALEERYEALDPELNPQQRFDVMKDRVFFYMEILVEDIRAAQAQLAALDNRQTGAAEHFRKQAEVDKARESLESYSKAALEILNAQAPVTVRREVRIVRGNRRN